MGHANIRKPVQKRSIETKEKILKAGFELICEKGYYNTNTVQIAKAANVSTGIVYQYFKDKHDILIKILQDFCTQTASPLIEILDKDLPDKKIELILKNIIDITIKKHQFTYSAHSEFVVLALSDPEVAEIYKNFEINLTNNFIDILIKHNFKIDNIQEKVHIAVHLIDDLCHEISYHQHNSINYDIMTDEVITIIANLFKNK